MAARTNCWEYMMCGREVGGRSSASLGVCPASTERGLSGVHGGRNAGRACWMVAATLCGGNVQGTYSEKERHCLACDFYQMVRREEKTANPQSII